MTARKKILIACTFACIAGLAIGVFFGVSMGRSVAQLMVEMKVIAAQAILSRFSGAQFNHADPAHARDAALLEIKILRELREAKADMPDTLPLSYGRLAISEESLGDQGAAKKAFDTVRSLTRKSGQNRSDLTDAEIKQWVTKLGSFGF